ncbi:hypothetical protein LguiA_000701 [Lonicera macranthoides]
MTVNDFARTAEFFRDSENKKNPNNQFPFCRPKVVKQLKLNARKKLECEKVQEECSKKKGKVRRDLMQQLALQEFQNEKDLLIESHRGKVRNRCKNPKGASTPSKDLISFVCAYRRGVVFSTLERQQQKVLSTVFITFNSKSHTSPNSNRSDATSNWTEAPVLEYISIVKS